MAKRLSYRHALSQRLMEHTVGQNEAGKIVGGSCDPARLPSGGGFQSGVERLRASADALS